MTADPPEGTSDAPPRGTLSADELHRVLERLNSDFYDRPDVRDQIAREILKALGTL